MRRALLLVAITLAGCGSSPPPAAPARPVAGRNQVVVMGTIHGGHRTNPDYGVAVVMEIVRRVRPDYVLAEIPPDRLPRAREEFERTGRITEPRVRIFPEYTDAIFPLTREMDFTIVGCAAWTSSMAESRRRELERLETTRPADTREYLDARREMNRRLDALGRSPEAIHTARYDGIVREGMEPYDRLFNDALGAGGWSNINAAHFSLIAAALDRHRGAGKRFLVTFGTWHKYKILAALAKRDDIEIVPLARFLD